MAVTGSFGGGFITDSPRGICPLYTAAPPPGSNSSSVVNLNWNLVFWFFEAMQQSGSAAAELLDLSLLHAFLLPIKSREFLKNRRSRPDVSFCCGGVVGRVSCGQITYRLTYSKFAAQLLLLRKPPAPHVLQRAHVVCARLVPGVARALAVAAHV